MEKQLLGATKGHKTQKDSHTQRVRFYSAQEKRLLRNKLSTEHSQVRFQVQNESSTSYSFHAHIAVKVQMLQISLSAQEV